MTINMYHRLRWVYTTSIYDSISEEQNISDLYTIDIYINLTLMEQWTGKCFRCNFKKRPPYDIYDSISVIQKGLISFLLELVPVMAL